MKRAFLLCDPGLLLAPPDHEDGEPGLGFWPRLIAWAGDRRLRLGPSGQEFVFETFVELGWPTFQPPGCPVGLQREARRALNTLLARVAMPADQGDPPAPPTLSPGYIGPPRGASTIGRDAAWLHADGLVGLATTDDHWERPTADVKVDPPPPEMLELAIAPHQRLGVERDHATARYLRERRLIIVGGVRSDFIVEAIVERFGLAADQIRWLDSEKGQRLNLDALDGLRAERDVVYCVTGHIGHAGSESAEAKCRRRGVEIRRVKRVNEIEGHLCESHGEGGDSPAADDSPQDWEDRVGP